MPLALVRILKEERAGRTGERNASLPCNLIIFGRDSGDNLKARKIFATEITEDTEEIHYLFKNAFL
jgi:hypothetical protein